MESRILSVQRETPDTVTLRIAAAFTFKPGQFAMVGAVINGVEVKRSYSISSTPNGEWIEVTVKQQVPGVFSEHAQHLVAGDPINVYGPYGTHFIFDMDATHDVVFIAGGSGIAPFRSMLQTMQRTPYKGKVVVLFSVKTRADIIFAQELDALAKKTGCTVVVTLTRPTESDTQQWSGRFGRITSKLLHEEVGEDLSPYRFYVCGSTAMVNDTRKLLEHLQVPKEHVKAELFGRIEN